jgi:hypothetical protein
VIKCLLSKYKALSSNLCAAKKKKKIELEENGVKEVNLLHTMRVQFHQTSDVWTGPGFTWLQPKV